MRKDPKREAVMRLRTILFAVLTLVVAGRGAVLAGEACYEHHFLGDKPAEENPGWHQEAQGLSHDADFWYAVQNVPACVLPEGHPFCPQPNSLEGCLFPSAVCELIDPNPTCATRRPGVVWKIPVTHDLSDPGAAAVATTSEEACNAGFNHVGDPTHYVHEGTGFVLAPLEGNGPGVAAFGADLAAIGMIDWAPLDPDASGQENASWIAVDAQGLLWSGNHEATELNRFQVDWDQLRDSGVLVITFLDHVPMLDENGQPLALASYEQGGDFSDDPALPFPLLYMVNGNTDDDCDCGIHVFEVRQAATGEACGSAPGPCVARRVDRSTNGSGDFNYAYNPGFSTYEEPEGLTFWDLDADPRAPGVSGQLHVVMLDNDDPTLQGDDDVYVKHYRLETDDVAPAIVCPADITVECTGNCGTEATDAQLAPFFAGASASDFCDPQVAITNDAPALFPLGGTLVTFTATDDFKNASSCAATVTVQDTQDPEITIQLDHDVLWPPNHKLVVITATVTVTDICDPNATFTLTSITSNEPDNGMGDGDTEVDIQGADFGTADTLFLLRSERSGGGSGRVYTIVYTASDKSGNTSQATATVQVPHDHSGLAKAATGFNVNGTGLIEGAPTFELVILSSRGFEARGVDPKTAQIGNTAGVVNALSSRIADMNRDGLADLVVRYSVPQASRVQQVSGENNPMALRYGSLDGTFYLVPDIFRLGPPLGTRTATF